MPTPPARGRRPVDPFKAAEDVFKPAAPKLPDDAPNAPPLPGARETVTLRIDREVLDFFQEDGPGWQERINAALRKAAGK
ncbi:MAG: BrnA antitoxin family protein [Bauldia sp.]|nr:BrnA antitoxin family protein [Bauldia sp.]